MASEGFGRIFRCFGGIREALVGFIGLERALEGLRGLQRGFRGLLEALVGFCKASEDFEENF